MLELGKSWSEENSGLAVEKSITRNMNCVPLSPWADPISFGPAAAASHISHCQYHPQGCPLLKLSDVDLPGDLSTKKAHPLLDNTYLE